ncbi:MFS transporter, partial [Neisseria meningitidis]
MFAYIGLATTAEKGVVPQTAVEEFYLGVVLPVISSELTISKVQQSDAETYVRYHGNADP